MNFYYLSQEVRAFMGNLEVQNIHKNCFHDGICVTQLHVSDYTNSEEY